jgi:hypothetical protein
MAACGLEEPTESGSIHVVNRHDSCALRVSIDGAEALTVGAGQSRLLDGLTPEGHALEFESDEKCVIYVTYSNTPFPSGRASCSVLVQEETQVLVAARNFSESTPSEIGVDCP